MRGIGVMYITEARLNRLTRSHIDDILQNEMG